MGGTTDIKVRIKKCTNLEGNSMLPGWSSDPYVIVKLCEKKEELEKFQTKTDVAEGEMTVADLVVPANIAIPDLELELELSRVFEALELVALIEFGVRVVADGLGLELLEPTNRLRPRRPRGRRRALLLLLAELDDHVRVRRPAREHRGALEVRAPAESNVTASC